MLQKLFNPEWQITAKSFLLSSFLIGFSFSPTAEISRLELEFEESLPRKTASKRGLDRSQMDSQSRKTNFLSLPDLAFGFVHKRSGNEISYLIYISFTYSHSPLLHGGHIGYDVCTLGMKSRRCVYNLRFAAINHAKQRSFQCALMCPCA